MIVHVHTGSGCFLASLGLLTGSSGELQMESSKDDYKRSQNNCVNRMAEREREITC